MQVWYDQMWNTILQHISHIKTQTVLINVSASSLLTVLGNVLMLNLKWNRKYGMCQANMLFQTATSGGSCNCSGFCSNFSHSYRLQTPSPVTFSTCSCLSVPPCCLSALLIHNVSSSFACKVRDRVKWQQSASISSLLVSLLSCQYPSCDLPVVSFHDRRVRLWQPAGRLPPGDTFCLSLLCAHYV